jgi:predicted DNA-binding transcriptional regulator AlpA
MNSDPPAVDDSVTRDWPPNKLLSRKDFCVWANVPERTFTQWCQDGTAPKRIKIGRHVRIRWADALVWLDSRYVRD